MRSTHARPARPHDPVGSPARTAARAGVLTFYVDQFDIYLPVLVLPGLLRSHVRLTATGASVAMLIEALALVVVFALYGVLSQRVGRRAFYIGYGLVVTILGSAPRRRAGCPRGAPRHRRAHGADGVGDSGHVRPVTTYLTELFPARLRGTGSGRLQPRAGTPRPLRVLPVGARRDRPLPPRPGRPGRGRGGPDDGWWLTFATHRATGESWLLVLHAADPASGPQARVRVPLGLHGNWPPTSA